MDRIKGIFICHKIELMVFVGSVMSSFLSIFILYLWRETPQDVVSIHPATENESKAKVEQTQLSEDIFVDVSGAVKKPGLYKVDSGSRLDTAIELSGGLAQSADVDFFARNYNLSRTLNDQEKIYVPRIDEVNNGTFVEGRYSINHSLERNVEDKKDTINDHQLVSNGVVNVNIASQNELEELPQIGPVTAQRIIDNRPYGSIHELRDKNVVSEAVFDKIKNRIGLE